MAKRISKRTSARWWAVVGIVGWFAVLFGLFTLASAVRSAFHSSEFRVEHLEAFFGSFFMLFFGSILAAASRRSGIKWFCSRCDNELRGREDRVCLHCMTQFD